MKITIEPFFFFLKTSVGFGFLASKEVREAGVGNLGLQDRKPTQSFVYSENLMNG